MVLKKVKTQNEYLKSINRFIAKVYETKGT